MALWQGNKIVPTVQKGNTLPTKAAVHVLFALPESTPIQVLTRVLHVLLDAGLVKARRNAPTVLQES
jgi:hypothetical protein